MAEGGVVKSDGSGKERFSLPFSEAFYAGESDGDQHCSWWTDVQAMFCQARSATFMLPL